MSMFQCHHHTSEAIWGFWIYRCVPNLGVVMATLQCFRQSDKKLEQEVFEDWKRTKFQGRSGHSLANRVCLSQLLYSFERSHDLYISMWTNQGKSRWVHQIIQVCLTHQHLFLVVRYLRSHLVRIVSPVPIDIHPSLQLFGVFSERRFQIDRPPNKQHNHPSLQVVRHISKIDHTKIIAGPIFFQAKH